ncbi:hypothetical protein SAMN05216436_120105 [bacterium A37T11]|nr:hypothetical protein SAMN05216436_120105 [bacterium A37T11]
MKKLFSILLLATTFLHACSKQAGPDNGGNNNTDDPDQGTGQTPIPYNALPENSITLPVAATEDYVNVMGTARPDIPEFATVSKKPSILRGYVKNRWGQPLEGAYIGVRSTAVGGYYSEASTTTNSKGYYEIKPPFGAVSIYAAGYVFEYGGLPVVQGLYPADGVVNNYTSEDGSVENFVLLPFGKGDPAALAEKPWYNKNYFGGAIRISYDVYEDIWSPEKSLPNNAEIEITLVPDGYLLDAKERTTFVIRKKVGNLNFNINNIPVGKYKITAKLINGQALRLKASDFYPSETYGLKPANVLQTGTVLFMPYASVAHSGKPYLGGWQDASIKLEMP